MLSSIQVPTLVVGRREDPPTRARHSDDAAAGIRESRLIRPENDPPAALHWYGWADAILQGVADLISEIDEEQRSFDRVLATILFSDIVASTASAASLGDRRWRDLVERHHSVVRGLLARYRGHEVDTAGDGFFATFDGPARAVRCGEAIAAGVHDIGLEVRIGIHTGEIGTVNDKVGGIAVHFGARIAALAGPSQILVSSTVKDPTLGAGLAFADAGERQLKGVPEPWHLYSVTTPDRLKGPA